MNTDIAVIGIGCRFPQAENIDAYYKLLINGTHAISAAPAYRNLDFLAGYLQDYGRFDAKLFNISPREAKLMDPQQRLMLEVVWQALEHGHISRASLVKKEIGVFIGVMANEWAKFSLSRTDAMDIHSGTGNGHCMIANRISYCYDFTGPSIALDTACSSSLTAVALACQSLENNHCELAVAGGVNMILTDFLQRFYQKAGLLSPDSTCRPFGSKANGIVRGEGGGIVVLKKLDKALSDKNRIFAVIKGWAVNHDGKSNGLTAPHKWTQIAVIQKALSKANIYPNQIDFIETHGTGTQLGDPIEASALGEAIGKFKSPSTPCFIGSVKSNIGHLEGAAGIAGLIKTILSIQENQIFPTLHVDTSNPLINFKANHLHPAVKLQQWRKNLDQDRFAGVSAFGLGGTNAHIIITNSPLRNIKFSAHSFYSFNGEKYWLEIFDSNQIHTGPLLTKKVLSIVSTIAHIPLSEISHDANFITDLGFDSLMQAELNTQIKENFHFISNLSFTEILNVKTIDQLIKLIEFKKFKEETIHA